MRLYSSFGSCSRSTRTHSVILTNYGRSRPAFIQNRSKISISIFIGQGQGVLMNPTTKYIIQTTAKLKEGTTTEVLELFKSTNPELVKDEPDWVKASFAAVEEENIVIVRAEWRSQESYLKFAESEKFRSTMERFGTYFVGQPKVTISKVLFEM